jgi:formylglycine-generating enzyme required for sulfatase activity
MKNLRKSLPLARMQVAGLFLYVLCFLCPICLASEPGMVFIPGGEFSRGRSYDWPDTRLAWYPNPLKDDTPVRKVYVNPFTMDEAEVTNERYAVFAKASRRKVPYHWSKGKIPQGQEKHPVVNVSWNDAVAFCGWEGKRLPTEAEWEHASRGLAEGRMYPWGDDNPTAKLAVYGSDAGAAAVCSKERNYFGLCDMIGNVWEWTADWYDRNYYEVSPDRDPLGPAQGIYRVLRGGSWFDQPPLFLTCSYRSWARPAERSPTIGFRCVRPIAVRKPDHRASLSP